MLMNVLWKQFLIVILVTKKVRVDVSFQVGITFRIPLLECWYHSRKTSFIAPPDVFSTLTISYKTTQKFSAWTKFCRTVSGAFEIRAGAETSSRLTLKRSRIITQIGGIGATARAKRADQTAIHTHNGSQRLGGRRFTLSDRRAHRRIEKRGCSGDNFLLYLHL